jgi:beta-phosphoglucomutase
MIDTIIFDFDGTMVDTEDYHTESLQSTIKEVMGIGLTSEQVEQRAGMTYKDKLIDLFDGKITDEQIEEISKKSYSKFKENFLDKITLKPGLLEFISKIVGKYKIGAYSPNEKIVLVTILKKFNLLKHFETVVSIEDVEKPKPHPEGYLKVAEILGSKPENCLVFEDTPTGFSAAKGAGMKTIVVFNPYLKDPKYPEADGFIKDFVGFDVEDIKKL